MSKLILPHHFDVRHYQRDLFRAHFIDKKRFLISINHRRSGKTKASVNFAIACAMNRVGVYFHVFPELKQARNVVWHGIDKDGKRYLDHIPKKIIDGRANNAEMKINFINGSTLFLAGGDRYDALMGTNPAGIILDEFSIMNPLAWHYLSPIITENEGWVLFPYTPRGANHGYDLYNTNLDNPDWFVQKLDVTQTFRNDGTPVITEEMIEERRRSGMPEELIQQEFYCSFDVALAGAFYSSEIEAATNSDRILDFPIRKDVEVMTGWDLGRRDPSSIWFYQPIDEHNIDIIGYYENQFKDMGHYIHSARSFCQERGLRLSRFYNFAPHDMQVVEYGSGKSRLEQAQAMGVHFRIAPKMSIMEGINAARMVFPKCRFHKTNCKIGLNALKQYVADDNGVPKHTWPSHGADAFRTFASSYLQCFGNPQELKSFIMDKFNP